jgi:hypothetical protein
VILEGGVVNVGAGAGVTVIILDAVIVLPHASVAVHVSVTVPPQGPGAAVCVDVAVPLIKQVPLAPLLYAKELVAGIAPHATVILEGGVVNVGAAAGVTVIVLDAVIVLPQASVAVHVSVTVPPQGPGAAV